MPRVCQQVPGCCTLGMAPKEAHSFKDKGLWSPLRIPRGQTHLSLPQAPFQLPFQSLLFYGKPSRNGLDQDLPSKAKKPQQRLHSKSHSTLMARPGRNPWYSDILHIITVKLNGII